METRDVIGGAELLAKHSDVNALGKLRVESIECVVFAMLELRQAQVPVPLHCPREEARPGRLLRSAHALRAQPVDAAG